MDDVIEGAFKVLKDFEGIRNQRDAMRSVQLKAGEAEALARAALALKYEPDPLRPAPITEAQILEARRPEDSGRDLWTTFNRVQENLTQGGLEARSINGRRRTTRVIQGIDQSVKVNRALWVLAEEMRRLKG